MKNSIVKSAAVAGHVIGLILGANFTTPATRTMEENPYIALY
jgi:hypothetical protein